MSYNFSLTSVPSTTSDEKLVEAILTGFDHGCGAGQSQNGTYDEAREAVAQVAKAAPHLVAALGPNVAWYKVSVAGHANPGHEQTPGWANDGCFISVTVGAYNPIPE